MMARIDLSTLAPLSGRWTFRPDLAVYEGPPEPVQGRPPVAPVGVAIAGADLPTGIARVTVTFPDYPRTVGRIVFGHNAATGAYFTAGIGGHGFAYVLEQFIPNSGWHALRTEGNQDNLAQGVPYRLEVQVRGQRVVLRANSVRVLEGTLPHPMTDDQMGLFAWGAVPVHFSDFEVDSGTPQAFVVMQYSKEFDVFFEDVIVPVARDAGYKAYRAADVYRPGLVLDDIVSGLAEAEVIIAEITPANQNVFYELGYAHALGKPTILLAERKQRGDLPFDIRGYRVIFYDDTIGGKKSVKANLLKHLRSIRGGWNVPPEEV